MTLQCQMAVNTPSYSAGQTPPPMATLTVFNPNATAVVVTGVQMAYTDGLGRPARGAIGQSLPPIGPGQTTSVPALSSITIGPFPIVAGTAAAASSFATVPPGSVPANAQGSQPPQFELNIGALVYGSDGSSNNAGTARVLVSYSNPPPVAYQGGFAFFDQPNNACLLAVI